MLLKVTCEHCGKGFESEGLDKTEFCPHCGVETHVSGRGYSAPAPIPRPGKISRLMACADCGQNHSIGAIWCPHCGRFHNVPFRLVWQATGAFYLALAILTIIGAVIVAIFEVVQNTLRQ